MKQIIKCCATGFILLWLAIYAHAQPNLVRVEYYIDADPGYNNATPISFAAGNNLSDIALNINPATLPYGVHVLGIRAKDANGAWSLDNKWIFARPYPNDAGGGPVPNLSRVEYFLDNDPGYGNATAVSFTPVTNLSDIAITIDTGTITTGVHVLGIRAKDANGAWSLDNKWIFAKPYPNDTGGGGPVPNLSRVEYYLDNDPGYGNGIAVSFTPGTNISDIAINIDPGTITNGVHVLGIRAKDANGAWSLDNKWLFARPYPNDTAVTLIPNLKQTEYYFDKDPGYGKGIPVAINTVTNLSNFSLPVNIAGLKAGAHKLFIRSKDANGAWSFDNKFNFSVSTALAAPAIVVNSVTKKTLCAKDTVRISYQSAGSYSLGNVFNVQLSDASGSFASPIIIGSRTDTSSGIIICALPVHITAGNLYRVRVNSTTPVVTGITGADSLTIKDAPYPQTITGASDANVGISYMYSVPSVAGSSWAWIAPAASVTQTVNSANLLWNVAAQPQTIKVIETNSSGCAGDTSSRNVNVYPLKIDTVRISTTTPCPGSNVTVTAKAFGIYDAGNSFTAQLSDSAGSFINAKNIGSAAAATFGNNQPVTINAVMPSPLSSGSGYKVRVVSGSPVVSGLDTLQNIVIGPPVKPGIITGKANNLCGGVTNVKYSIDSVPNIISYNWTVPKNCTIASGQGTVSIKVNIASNFTAGYITVTSVNSCGISAPDSLRITAKPAATTTIKGPKSAAVNQSSLIYSVTNVAGLTYTWSVPSGAIITSGQGTDSITVTWGSISGAVTVYATNACGNSPTKTLNVSLMAGFASTGDEPENAIAETKLYAKVYPNPSHNDATVAFNANNVGKYTVEIIDVTGKVLQQVNGTTTLGENTIKINAAEYAQGIYLIKITDAEGQQVLKFVKQ